MSFSRPDTPSSIISNSSESSSSGVQHDGTGSYYRLVRWEETHAKLLIALWKQFKHLITEGKSQKRKFLQSLHLNSTKSQRKQ